MALQLGGSFAFIHYISTQYISTASLFEGPQNITLRAAELYVHLNQQIQQHAALRMELKGLQDFHCFYFFTF